MTALVAVMNKQAVALAADSAVTTSGPPGQLPKIYNTNKVFTLSKRHPVGIMVYSSADVMSLPVETVIKVYRQQLDAKRQGEPFPRLSDYCDDFVSFLKSDLKVFPEQARLDNARELVAGVLLRLAAKCLRKIDATKPSGAAPSGIDIAGAIRIVLKRDYDAFKSASGILSGVKGARRRLRAELNDMVAGFEKRVGEQFGHSLSADEKRMVSDICVGALTTDIPATRSTGFVVAGFGEDEYVPQLHSFTFASSVLGYHKIHKAHEIDVSERGGGGTIVPFAQTEMMETFVEGRARAFSDCVQSAVGGFFDKWKEDAVAEAPIDSDSAKSCQVIDELRAGLLERIKAETAAFTDREHIQPILSNVSNMPKEELAVMAEALVNLTAMKRHVASAAETVGGPTDVAVISKGDGFIWIKRKHYFQPELNVGFAENYHRNEVPK